MLQKTHEENLKVKAPRKDYLEGDANVKYKEDQASEVEVEKPKFFNKAVGDTAQPHFVDINKNEDVRYLIYLVIHEKYVSKEYGYGYCI